MIAAGLTYSLASLHIVPFGISRLLTLGYRQFMSSDVGPGTTAVVVLGGGDEFVEGWSDNRTAASSLTMRDELVRLGVPVERILLESTSRTTYENAVLTAPMLESLGIQQVVLITSGTHMRRALGAFRAVGVNAVPAIAPDPGLPTQWFWWLLPTAGGLELSGEIGREVGGIPYYWLRGRWR